MLVSPRNYMLFTPLLPSERLHCCGPPFHVLKYVCCSSVTDVNSALLVHSTASPAPTYRLLQALWAAW